MPLNHSLEPLRNTPLAFDYQSTTPCDDEVLDAMEPYWNHCWGNASSRQSKSSISASSAVSFARDQLAKCLGIDPNRIIFTSGATEANNLALLGYARARVIRTGDYGNIITVATEHHAVLDPLNQLEKEGFTLTKIYPKSDGILSLNQFKDAINKNTFMASIMMANNEIGVIQQVGELVKICRDSNIILHSDAAQSFGHIPLDLNEIDVDFLSLSGHKCYGPKGIGALVIRENLPILPLQWGGSQEKSLRPGTPPVPLIIGFSKAAELATKNLCERYKKIKILRDKLWHDLNSEIPELIINGSLDYRLPHNLNFTVNGVNGARLHRHLRPFVECSSGSACSNGEPSHVLMAIGRNLKEAEASLRLSLGKTTTLEDVKYAVELISKVISDLRKT